MAFMVAWSTHSHFRRCLLSELICGDWQKLGAPFWGPPIIRSIIYWDLDWGPPLYGNYHVPPSHLAKATWPAANKCCDTKTNKELARAPHRQICTPIQYLRSKSPLNTHIKLIVLEPPRKTCGFRFATVVAENVPPLLPPSESQPAMRLKRCSRFIAPTG